MHVFRVIAIDRRISLRKDKENKEKTKKCPWKIDCFLEDLFLLHEKKNESHVNNQDLVDKDIAAVGIECR